MLNKTTLNPEVNNFLIQFNELSKTIPADLSVEEGRSSFEQFAMTHAGIPIKIARVEDHTISNRDNSYNIPIRIYTPLLNTKLPAILYIHGGGWQRGSINSHDSICRNLAVKSNCIVVSIEWRLTPEYKFPAGLQDCWDAYHWLLKNAPDYHIDEGKIGIAGDSGGATLVAAITLLLKKEHKKQPLFQLLLYPSLDLSCSTPSYKTYGTGYFLTADRVKYYVNHYINSSSDLENPLCSPSAAKDLSGLAPAYIITAGFDPLRDEGKLYADKLKKFHVPVVYQCYESMIHAFLHMTGTVKEVNLIFDEIVKTLQQDFLTSKQDIN